MASCRVPEVLLVPNRFLLAPKHRGRRPPWLRRPRRSLSPMWSSVMQPLFNTTTMTATDDVDSMGGLAVHEDHRAIREEVAAAGRNQR
jgi:hypothetical protein